MSQLTESQRDYLLELRTERIASFVAALGNPEMAAAIRERFNRRPVEDEERRAAQGEAKP